MSRSTSRCLRQITPNPSRRLYSSRTIKEHDVLYIRQQGPSRPRWHLTRPLRPDSRVKLGFGASFYGRELIGRNFLDRIQDSNGSRLVLQEATLSKYILNVEERLATPIYPHDANTIVSLLDLHPSRPGEDDPDEPPLEIFEAGTGMGSLTLHLARAIHGANPPFPRALRDAICNARLKYPSPDDPPCLSLSPEEQDAYDEYASSRRAVLHTLDRNPKHTHAAYKLVRNFRRGQYLPSIDFHTGSVDEYISTRLTSTNGKPFLSHALLDLPSAQTNAAQLVKALFPGGNLIVFNPSISQIADFLTWSMTTSQRLQLERVIELPLSTVSEGSTDSAGGRHWDVRTVLPKKTEGGGEPVQIMRPKVGDRVAGGGFIGVFRKFGDDGREADVNAETPAESEFTAAAPATESQSGDGANQQQQ